MENLFQKATLNFVKTYPSSQGPQECTHLYFKTLSAAMIPMQGDILPLFNCGYRHSDISFQQCFIAHSVGRSQANFWYLASVTILKAEMIRLLCLISPEFHSSHNSVDVLSKLLNRNYEEKLSGSEHSEFKRQPSVLFKPKAFRIINYLTLTRSQKIGIIILNKIKCYN